MQKKWGKNAICGITHTRLRPGKYKNGSKRCIFLDCKHGFYTRPLFIWLENDPHVNPTCPLCRQNINEKNLLRKMFE